MTATLASALVDDVLSAYSEASTRPSLELALLDYQACLVAGQRLAPVALGQAGRASWLDRDDVHPPSMTHPGAIIWTALRQVGDWFESPPWRAAYVGYEVTARVGLALGPDHRRYWHATATAGSLGAAAACAVVMEVDAARAVEHAASVAGGSVVAVLQRSETRALHRDHAVAVGIRSARAAGCVATQGGLEHERGLFVAMGGDPGRLLVPGGEPAVAELTFRLHSTSGFAQAVVEAAQSLAPVDEPGEIVIELSEVALGLAGDPRPSTLDAAWWSAPYAVAVTLLGLDLADPAAFADPRVSDLLDRTVAVAAGTSAVSVDGRRVEVDAPRRASLEDLRAKWRLLNPDVPYPALGPVYR